MLKKMGTVPPTVYQVLGLVALIVTQLALVVRHMSKSDVQYWIGQPKKLGAELRKIFLQTTPVTDALAEWQCFYQEVFGRDLDITPINLPDECDDFGWLVLVAQGLTLNQVYDNCAERFPSWRYTDDLDKAITHNDRTTKSGSYAIRLRDRVEADEELKNLSANQLKEQNISGVTLMERLLLELWYYWKTGNHLDIQNWTLCSGSRYSGGRVPFVHWCTDDRELHVLWLNPDSRSERMRTRAVVS